MTAKLRSVDSVMIERHLIVPQSARKVEQIGCNLQIKVKCCMFNIIYMDKCF